MEEALLAAAEDRRPAPALGSEAADADAARRGGARRGDLGAVHDRDREAGLGVVDDDQPGDVREPSFLVRRVAADPLERDDVLVAQVRGHRVEEGVLARVDAGLRRQLDPARGQRAVGVLDEVELLVDVRAGGRRPRPG